MDLRTYLDGLPPGGVTVLAGKLGISRVYLSQLAAKQNDRQPSPKLCLAIEQKTDGRVTRQSLRDDWKEIWPDSDRRKEARA